MNKTKISLLLAAEQLIGDQGLNNVSLRQISERSGNRNVAAAQYHFESMERLILALIEYRKAAIDHFRERFYRERDMDFRHMTVRDYVTLIAWPHHNIRDQHGVRRFARLLKALQQDPHYYAIWQQHYHDSPFANAIYFGLRKALSTLPEPVWDLRMKSMGKFIVSMIVDQDQTETGTRLEEEAFVSEVIAMVVACLTADAQHVIKTS